MRDTEHVKVVLDKSRCRELDTFVLICGNCLLFDVGVEIVFVVMYCLATQTLFNPLPRHFFFNMTPQITTCHHYGSLHIAVATLGPIPSTPLAPAFPGT